MKFHYLLLLIFYAFLNAQTDTMLVEKKIQKTKIIKINESLFENDIIKTRQFSWPFISFEKDYENDLTWIFSIKYAYYNYKNDTYFPTNNYYKYYGLINHKINADAGIRWYMFKDPYRTFGKGVFMTGLFSMGYYRSVSEFSAHKFSYWVPALGLGLGYQNFISNRISYDIEVLFRKGIKLTYLNGKFYPQPNINYNNIALRVGLGYAF